MVRAEGEDQEGQGRQANLAPPRAPTRSGVRREANGRSTPSARFDPMGVPAAERARRVLEELRRRLGEPARPREEMDYLERSFAPLLTCACRMLATRHVYVAEDRDQDAFRNQSYCCHGHRRGHDRAFARARSTCCAAATPNRSQTLMRWRVGLQFAVILIIMGVLWFRG